MSRSLAALGTTLLLLAAFVPAAAADVCEGYGPQTPRDIDDPAGENARIFSLAPSSSEMNLCNIHFHAQAEHRAEDFSLTTDGKPGYQCVDRANLTEAELAPFPGNRCAGVEPGDTIEVHWVHSSCDVAPGPTLRACLSSSCANPDLRVETQVFLVVNDSSAMDFSTFAEGAMVDGYHQPKALPASTGAPVEFAGSTTGPSYTEQKCSPLQVSWSVRPSCARVDITSLSAWCAQNAFEEAAAQGVRELVTDRRLLAPVD